MVFLLYCRFGVRGCRGRYLCFSWDKLEAALRVDVFVFISFLLLWWAVVELALAVSVGGAFL